MTIFKMLREKALDFESPSDQIIQVIQVAQKILFPFWLDRFLVQFGLIGQNEWRSLDFVLETNREKVETSLDQLVSLNVVRYCILGDVSIVEDLRLRKEEIEYRSVMDKMFQAELIEGIRKLKGKIMHLIKDSNGHKSTIACAIKMTFSHLLDVMSEHDIGTELQTSFALHVMPDGSIPRRFPVLGYSIEVIYGNAAADEEVADTVLISEKLRGMGVSGGTTLTEICLALRRVHATEFVVWLPKFLSIHMEKSEEERSRFNHVLEGNEELIHEGLVEEYPFISLCDVFWEMEESLRKDIISGRETTLEYVLIGVVCDMHRQKLMDLAKKYKVDLLPRGSMERVNPVIKSLTFSDMLDLMWEYLAAPDIGPSLFLANIKEQMACASSGERSISIGKAVRLGRKFHISEEERIAAHEENVKLRKEMVKEVSQLKAWMADRGNVCVKYFCIFLDQMAE